MRIKKKIGNGERENTRDNTQDGEEYRWGRGVTRNRKEAKDYNVRDTGG